MDKYRFHFNRFSEFFLVAAIFFMGVRNKDLTPIPFLHLTDIMVILSGVFLALDRDFRIFMRDHFRKFVPYLKFLSVIIVFIFIGQFFSFMRFGSNPFSSEVLIDYLRMFLNIITFLIAVFVVYRNIKVLRLASSALIASFVFIIPVYFLKEGQEIYFSAARLSGLISNSIVFGALAAIAIVISFGMILQNIRRWKKAVIIAWLAFIVAFILWSGARAAWLSLVLAAVLFVILLSRQRNWSGLIFASGVVILVIVCGYFLIGNNYKYNMPSEKMQTYLELRAGALATSFNPYYQDRVSSWLGGSAKILSFPFGFGFLDLENKETYPSFASTFLETAVYGGVFAFFGFIVFLLRLGFLVRTFIGKNLIDDPQYLLISWVIAGAVFLVNIAAFNFFQVRIFWLLFGIIVGVIFRLSFSEGEKERVKLFV